MYLNLEVQTETTSVPALAAVCKVSLRRMTARPSASPKSIDPNRKNPKGSSTTPSPIIAFTALFSDPSDLCNFSQPTPAVQKPTVSNNPVSTRYGWPLDRDSNAQLVWSMSPHKTISRRLAHRNGLSFTSMALSQGPSGDIILFRISLGTEEIRCRT